MEHETAHLVGVCLILWVRFLLLCREIGTSREQLWASLVAMDDFGIPWSFEEGEWDILSVVYGLHLHLALERGGVFGSLCLVGTYRCKISNKGLKA